MITSLLIATLLLAANAFFVAAEFALVKLKSFRVDAFALEGGHSARLTQRIHRNLEPYLAACQLGITMASLGLGWVGEPTVAAILTPLLEPTGLSEKAVHTIAFLSGFIIFSSLHIVVGEQVPKTFAIRKPEIVATWIAFPLHGFFLLIYPLNWILNAASAKILHLFNVEEASHSEILSGEEIQGLIEESGKHGNIESQKADMLRNLFEFDTTTVEEIMVPRAKVSHIDLQSPWETQLEVFNRIEHSRFPVIDGGDQNLVGVILAKDLYRQAFSGQGQLREGAIRDVVRDPLLVPETQLIGVLFEAMQSSRQHMAVVIDEYGSFSGVVTMEDLLEEIVGEIADELDQASDRTILIDRDGGWECDGWTQLSDIERALKIQFEENVDANSLTGLFMFVLSRIPEVGDIIEEQNFRFTVKSMDGHRVNIVKIESFKSEEEEPEDGESEGE